MINYLEFKDAKCKDCYKCLRGCPVKAIKVVKHQAQIISDRCILCGTCTQICPQNAKKVHSERNEIESLLKSDSKVIASVAPSFVASFGIDDFAAMRDALIKLGFDDAEETARGARVVTDKYAEILDNESNKYKNFITSACPAVNRLIQLYYPDALKYLAPVDSPMIAHAKLIIKDHPNTKIVFIGPCIAKKREAHESGYVDAVLTFEELSQMFIDNNIILTCNEESSDNDNVSDTSRYYPISRGIIKSFITIPKGYECMAVDGLERCVEVLNNINSLSGMFIELNTCKYSCINGPCSIPTKGGAIKANADIREYASKNNTSKETFAITNTSLNIEHNYERIYTNEYTPTPREIKEILAKTGKLTIDDELNCGACGYPSCRDKAWAVVNGYANIDMCLPYMRERAESMSYEIIQNSPNGIIVLDDDFKVTEINNKAIEMLGLEQSNIKGQKGYDYFDTSDFVMALSEEKNILNKKIHITKTNRFAELSVILLKNHKVLFGEMKDITEETNYDEKLNAIRMKTLSTTDEVIKKQMRVAQEIASLLGETTAESKVALLKLKQTLLNDNGGDKDGSVH